MTEEIILKVENLSKQYRLGVMGTGTVSHDLNRWWSKIRGKRDPYLKVGEINDRATKGNSDYVWALKDIGFDVKKGEVLGIIGKNGAGKSTLLKILSQVTGPTTGSIKSKGRIASLLEVGTGFHPEMTGKENIFLNGAILGMTKKEIAYKLDEIVGFSGCERYIDTPVKRYSSGMKVRLAFAVAAHLEPDILIVDEVLAVGDAEFQKKAIGKMEDISKSDGRTVLFVSHDMAAIKSLCNRVIVIENGKVVYDGGAIDSVDYYLFANNDDGNYSMRIIKDLEKLKLNNIVIKQNNNVIQSGDAFPLGSKFVFSFEMSLKENVEGLCISMNVIDNQENLISHITNQDDGISFEKVKKGNKYIVVIETDQLLFIPGRYMISLWFGTFQKYTLLDIQNFFVFDLVKGNLSKRPGQIPAHSRFYLPTKWKVND